MWGSNPASLHTDSCAATCSREVEVEPEEARTVARRTSPEMAAAAVAAAS